MSADARKRRAALEAIAYGEGSTADQRLRALELLAAIPEEAPPRDFAEEVAALSDAELDAWLDGLTSVAFAVMPEDELARRFPETRRALERRAEQLAARLYVDRGIEELGRELADG